MPASAPVIEASAEKVPDTINGFSFAGARSDDQTPLQSAAAGETVGKSSELVEAAAEEQFRMAPVEAARELLSDANHPALSDTPVLHGSSHVEETQSGDPTAVKVEEPAMAVAAQSEPVATEDCESAFYVGRRLQKYGPVW